MDPLASQIAALHTQGRLRVWSLVITVFGDLVQHRGGQISSARLGCILGRVGVEQGALRTALSRLGRDGWVHRERIGRNSLYRLSAKGVERFAPATPRIYAPPRRTPVEQWAIALRAGPAGRHEATLMPADEIAEGADCLVVGELRAISQSYRANLLGDEHRAALEALAGDIAALDAGADLSPLDAAAARILLIHRWRRIVLKYPEIPAELMPEDAPLGDPRAVVAHAYHRLTPATENWLGNDFEGLPAMPDGDGTLALRFARTQRG